MSAHSPSFSTRVVVAVIAASKNCVETNAQHVLVPSLQVSGSLPITNASVSAGSSDHLMAARDVASTLKAKLEKSLLVQIT